MNERQTEEEGEKSESTPDSLHSVRPTHREEQGFMTSPGLVLRLKEKRHREEETEEDTRD